MGIDTYISSLNYQDEPYTIIFSCSENHNFRNRGNKISTYELFGDNLSFLIVPNC